MPYHNLATEPHVVETPTDQQTWRLLWSHAARNIVSSVAATSSCEQVTIGAGWGLRNPDNHRCALLVHPTMQNRAIGDLALTVPGSGTHIIPRCGLSYTDYLNAVTDIVETTARTHLT